MYSQRMLGGARPTFSPALSRALPWAHAAGLRLGGSSTSLLTSCGSAPIEAQRETRRVSIMQKWKGGNRKTREQVHKKMTRVQRNQERAEYQRVKLHLKQGTLYEYIEGKTADEETKRKWFHQHFGSVKHKSRLAEEVIVDQPTGSGSTAGQTIDLDAGTSDPRQKKSVRSPR